MPSPLHLFSSSRALRRRFISLILGAGGWTLLTGHSPYRQWIAYRQAHLLLFTTRDDPRSDDLGERRAARLRQALPESRARAARAPHTDRLASLLSSGQADTAVVAHEVALALLRGEPPFAEYGPVALCALGQTERYLLVCRAAFRPRHAFLVAEALCRGEAPLLSLPDPNRAPPAHPGALAGATGRAPDE
jgi:hypothetical protein